MKELLILGAGTGGAVAASLMTRGHFSGPPVLDVEDKLAGILAEAEFLSALHIHVGSAIQDLFDTLIRKRRSRRKTGTIAEDIMTRDAG